MDWVDDAGSLFGVYATSMREEALAFALGAVPGRNGGVTRFIRHDPGGSVQMVFVHGHPNFGGKGYIYTVSSRGFRLASDKQWVCSKDVVPLEVEEIAVDDYLHLFRYATPDDYVSLFPYATEEEKRRIRQVFEERIRRSP